MELISCKALRANLQYAFHPVKTIAHPNIRSPCEWRENLKIRNTRWNDRIIKFSSLVLLEKWLKTYEYSESDESTGYIFVVLKTESNVVR